MRIIYRLDGQDFESLSAAVAYAAAKHFPDNADIQTEKQPNADGWEWLVFDDKDDSDEPVFVTIYEVEG